MQKIKLIGLLLLATVVIGVVGCGKKDDETGEMTPTKAKIDNNAPAAATAEGAAPATDTPTPGGVKGARSKGQAPGPMTPGTKAKDAPGT